MNKKLNRIHQEVFKEAVGVKKIYKKKRYKNMDRRNKITGLVVQGQVYNQKPVYMI